MPKIVPLADRDLRVAAHGLMVRVAPGAPARATAAATTALLDLLTAAPALAAAPTAAPTAAR